MKNMIALVTILLLSACAGDDKEETVFSSIPPAAVQETELTVPVCGPTLNVPDSLMDIVAVQAQRWVSATGCAVTYSSEGTPVHLVKELFDPEGRVIWGDTEVHTVNGKFASCTSLTVSLQSRDLDQTFGHELGHCWGATGGIDGGGHTVDGLMKAWHKPEEDGHINADALNLVCTNVPCVVFNPER